MVFLRKNPVVTQEVEDDFYTDCFNKLPEIFSTWEFKNEDHLKYSILKLFSKMLLKYIVTKESPEIYLEDMNSLPFGRVEDPLLVRDIKDVVRKDVLENIRFMEKWEVELSKKLLAWFLGDVELVFSRIRREYTLTQIKLKFYLDYVGVRYRYAMYELSPSYLIDE